ncbi:MAG: 7-carboxy-7-deazaguanine synthase QueE [Solirubrobacteraceae bacterium]
MEHFYTLQGEGRFAGTPSYFIRLGGCDIGCHWCDVKESWDAATHPKMEINEIVKIASETCKTIVITGGEPLMYNLDQLTLALKNNGCKVHIETSGAYSLSGKLDWICLSPKKNKLPLPALYQKANELKVIIYNQHDFLFAKEQAELVNTNCELYLQPEWSKKDTITQQVVDFVLENPNWKISLQTHKYLNIP